MNPPKRPASNPRNFSDLPNGAHYLAPMPPTLSGQALVAIAEGDLPAGVEYAVKAARCIMALRDLGELGP